MFYQNSLGGNQLKYFFIDDKFGGKDILGRKITATFLIKPCITSLTSAFRYSPSFHFFSVFMANNKLRGARYRYIEIVTLLTVN